MWRETARKAQLPPDGSWRVWYIRGGRGSGKTRTGSETLADWILHGTGDQEWAIVAPTYGDARDVCMEGKSSGLITALGGQNSPLIVNWNRSMGELYLANGSKVYIDGADDGALRIQGRNLSGAWCDEIGLWRNWDRAWNESLAFAVRIEPGLIVATGTPKMGHPLVQQLIDDPHVPCTHMRTVENIGNLHPVVIDELRRRYEGTRLGRQELEGEFLAEVEGDILKREWWQCYPPAWIGAQRGGDGDIDWHGPPPDGLIGSWDTALKEKTTNDYTVGTLWVTSGANRYLIRKRRDHWNLPDTIREVKALYEWGEWAFPNLPHRVLIENTANGPEIISALRNQIPGVLPVNPRTRGDKVQAAHSVTPMLESGNVLVPGVKNADGSIDAAAWVTDLIDECALFQPDAAHDDQVDSVTQALLHGRPRLKLVGEQVESWQPRQLSAGLMSKSF